MILHMEEKAVQNSIVAGLQALFREDCSICSEDGARGFVGRGLRAAHNVVESCNDCGVISLLPKTVYIYNECIPSSLKSSLVRSVTSYACALMEGSIRARDSVSSGAFATTWK